MRPHPLAEEVVGELRAPADLQDVAHVDAVGRHEHHHQRGDEEASRWRRGTPATACPAPRRRRGCWRSPGGPGRTRCRARRRCRAPAEPAPFLASARSSRCASAPRDGGRSGDRRPAAWRESSARITPLSARRVSRMHVQSQPQKRTLERALALAPALIRLTGPPKGWGARPPAPVRADPLPICTGQGQGRGQVQGSLAERLAWGFGTCGVLPSR